VLGAVACVDGVFNCIDVIKTSCGDTVKGFADITKGCSFIANKVKEGFGLETGN